MHGPAAMQATVFPSPQKPTFPNSNSIWNQVDEEPINLWMCYLQISIYLFSRLYYSLLTKAPILGLNSGLLIFCGKKAKFCGIFRRKFAEKSADFARFLREKSENLWKNWPISRKESQKFTEKSADFTGF